MSKDTTPFVIDETPRFIAIPYEFIDLLPKMDGACLATYLVLKAMAGSSGGCYPSMTYLSKRCGSSTRTVQRAISVLVDLGLVRVVPRIRSDGGSSSNQYILSGGLVSKSSPHPVTPVSPQEQYVNVEQDTYSSSTFHRDKNDSHDKTKPTPKDLLIWWCEKYHVEKLASYGKEMAFAKRLITAGLKLDEADALHSYIASNDYWRDMDAIPLAVMLSQYNRWRAAGSPASTKRYIPDV